jgi:hypothetical protein
MTCKDCLHYKVCELKRNHYYLGSPIGEIDEAEIGCHNFTDSSEWVHLPCGVDDTVYTIYNASLSHYKVVEIIVNDFVWAKLYNGEYSGEYKSKLICLDFSFNEFVFLTREEAEKALKEMQK